MNIVCKADRSIGVTLQMVKNFPFQFHHTECAISGSTLKEINKIFLTFSFTSKMSFPELFYLTLYNTVSSSFMGGGKEENQLYCDWFTEDQFSCENFHNFICFTKYNHRKTMQNLTE
jgi:hypothetical protein